MPILDLTTPQSDFYISDAEYVAAVAGFGSGKTQAAITKILASKFKYPGIDQAYLAPTYSMIKSIFYPRVAEVLSDMGVRFGINKQDHEINIQGHGKIICRTMDNPDMIVGWECGDAVMDEFDLMPTDKALQAMKKVSARCRQKFPDGKVNQKCVTTTPEGFKATYKLFKKEPLENSQLVQMSTRSNEANLPDGYIDSLIQQYPEQLIDAYLDGEFVNLTSGSVYYGYDRELCNTHYVQRPREVLHVGMDFNVYHMASIVHVLRDDVLYAVDEIIDLRDTPDMIAELKERYPGHPIIVYPDSSGKSVSSKGASLSDHKLLRDAKFRVKSRSTNPLVRDRLASMNGGFEHGKYKVNVSKCPTYVECLEQQVFDKNGAPDKTSGLDHPVDAGGYCKHYMLPVVKRGVADKVMGGF